jgi:hypothetical protein
MLRKGAERPANERAQITTDTYFIGSCVGTELLINYADFLLGPGQHLAADAILSGCSLLTGLALLAYLAKRSSDALRETYELWMSYEETFGSRRQDEDDCPDDDDMN